MQIVEAAALPLAHDPSPATGWGRWRLLIGLIQGGALYGLWYVLNQGIPVAWIPWLAATQLVLSIVPVLALSCLGTLTARATGRWLVAATLVLVYLALHLTWHHPGTYSQGAGDGHLLGLTFFLAIAAYITQSLLMAAARDGRRLAGYARYFEVAWQLILQYALSTLFLLLLWLALWLGSSLFLLVKLAFFQQLLEKPWFVMTSLAVGFAGAMHLTDVRPGIVRGTRTLLLVLLSWLLPIATLIFGSFLLSLPFTGLTSLWATHHATAVLLAADAMLIMLINTAYQSGENWSDIARLIRGCARLAAGMLLPISLIAAYALQLRVAQYGWSIARVDAAACTLLALGYMAGYGWATLRSERWLAMVAKTNIAMAWAVIAVMLALFSPIADPARLAAHNQMVRLLSGKTPVEQFDFIGLNRRYGTYGEDALQQIQAQARGKDADLIRHRAAEALKSDSIEPWQPTPPTPPNLLANLTVWPKTAQLPAGIAQVNWATHRPQSVSVPSCLTMPDAQCDVYLLKLFGGDHAQLLVVPRTRYEQSDPPVVLDEVAGNWRIVGTLPFAVQRCAAIMAQLQASTYQVQPSSNPTVRVGDWQLAYQAVAPSVDAQGCPMAEPAPEPWATTDRAKR